MNPLAATLEKPILPPVRQQAVHNANIRKADNGYIINFYNCFIGADTTLVFTSFEEATSYLKEVM